MIAIELPSRAPNGPIPHALVDKAGRLFDELIQSTTRQVVCHGDLHHYNVVSSQRGWLAIDPKGMVADPGYDTAPLLLNPDIELTKPLIERRIYQLADELGMEMERIHAWGYAHTVLSAIWCVEDGGDCWQGVTDLAEIFESIR